MTDVSFDSSEPARTGSGLAPLRRYWALALAAVLAAAGAWIGLRLGLVRLNEKWLDEYSYSHGYLVLLMSAWLFVKAVRERPVAEIGPSAIGLLALALCALGYLITYLLQFTLGMQILLPALLLAVIAALAGLAMARRAVLPVAFLYFAIPLWDVTIRPLQIMATKVVTAALSITDITAFIEGSRIATASGSFEIGDACAGQRFLVVGLAIAAFYALSWYRRWSSRVMLLIAAGGISIVSNWIRVYSLILIGHYTRMQHYLIVEEHYYYGWAIFTVMMIPVLWLARRLEQRELDAAVPAEAGIAEPAPRLAAAPRLLLTAAAVFGLLSIPAWIVPQSAVPETPASLVLAAPQGGWVGTEPATDWQPDYQKPAARLHQGFVRDGQQVDAYVARYQAQHVDSKLIANANSLDSGWQTTDVQTVEVNAGEERITLTELTLSAGGERRVVWFWFDVGAFQTHDRRVAKLLELPALVLGRRDGAVVALSARCSVGCESARESLQRLIADLGGDLQAIAQGDGVTTENSAPPV